MNRIKSLPIISVLLAALVITACGGNAAPADPAAVPTITGLPSGGNEGNSAPEQEQQSGEGYPAPEESTPPEGYPDPSATPDPYASP
ncbi:MAG: hypothetical protein H0T73_19785 [Ardenticatenales bacterium]|nr:hypothetical protein [Ardenticatenales bacterium]